MPVTDRLTEIHDSLVRAVESLASGEDWQRMLEVAHRFHTYSPNNIWLILAQRANASTVCGYARWRELGRHVKAGERGIAILAPCVYSPRPNDADEVIGGAERVSVLRGFRVVYVFDISQTEGRPLEDVAPLLLEGDAPTVLWERLESEVSAAGFKLVREDCRPANAVTHFLSRTVVVRPDLSPAQAAKSLCHELAHIDMHDGTEYARGCREVVEIEAESVAFLVCAEAQLSTDGYSFPYVARWANGDADLVRHTAERVIGSARRILAAIETRGGLGCTNADLPIDQ